MRRESILPGADASQHTTEEAIIGSLGNESDFRRFADDNFSAVMAALQHIRDEYRDTLAAHNLLAEEVDELREVVHKLKEDNNQLLQEADQHKQARLRTEGALSYVKDQLAVLRANQMAAPRVPPAQVSTQSATPPPDGQSVVTSIDSTKVIEIRDPEVFDGKDLTKFSGWLLQVKSKMRANAIFMPTEELRMAFVTSLLTDDALAQLEPRLLDGSTKPFANAAEMLQTLESAFGDPNRKQKAHERYIALRQGDRDFTSFWVEFQRLAAELDFSEKTLIDDLIEQSQYMIQQQLAIGIIEDLTSVNELAKRWPRIEYRFSLFGIDLADQESETEDAG